MLIYNYIKLFLLAFLMMSNAFLSEIFAQKNTAKNNQTELKTDTISEVVVTATRIERQLSSVPMPVLLIGQKQIKAIGSLRLNEVLQEQTGLSIQTNHGNGIQMQGLNPDYTLILIDGEPLIGRTAGTLELSRLAVGNIKQIEIVKGASSSLYGSEALAGVVNIITEKPDATKATFSARYGTNKTADFSASVNFKKDKFSFYGFLNRYSTNGYDLQPETIGKTVDAYQNGTFQVKINYDFSKKLQLSLSSRYFSEYQESNFDIGTVAGATQKPNLIIGDGQVKEFNINPVAHYKISDKWKTQFRFYNSTYKTASKLLYKQDNQVYDESFFTQSFIRPEIQTEYYHTDKHIFIFGLGKIWESVEATRYTNIQKFSTNYAFFQYEWLPTQKWNVILGGRLDNHTVYGTQFSPKLSAQYEISKKIALRASAGMGFKAPDFRQLYLNFTNAVAGYSVFGTEELPNALAQLQAQNQITEVLLDPSVIGKLQAESSISLNIGAKIKPTEKININVNIFRNDISNLIETQAFARKTNGQNVFSYRNLNKVFTQGAEIDISYNLNKKFTFSAGYQFLQAKDKKVLEQLQNGELFSRNPQTLITKRLTTADYGGLFGRSRDMLNVKLFYDNQKQGFSANIRGIYKGKYGLGDTNGNLILDDENEYVKGYVTWNLSASKTLFKEKIRLQIGLDNIFDKTDVQNIPSLAGRLAWISANFQLF